MKTMREMIFPTMDETTFMRTRPITIDAPERPIARFFRVWMSVDAHKEFIPSP